MKHRSCIHVYRKRYQSLLRSLTNVITLASKFMYLLLLVLLLLLLSIIIILFIGKFKGLSSQCDISVDDLIDLLHSVDHDKVVNNQDAVISDKALAALLDRTMNNEQEGPSIKDASITEQAVTNHYQDNFKVIAERDGRGNLIRSDIVGEESVDTVDSLAIKQDLQAMDSGCEVASSSSLFSTSPEPFSSEDGLKSNSSSSFFSCDSNALGPSTSPPVMKPMQQDATQESY